MAAEKYKWDIKYVEITIKERETVYEADTFKWGLEKQVGNSYLNLDVRHINKAELLPVPWELSLFKVKLLPQ